MVSLDAEPDPEPSAGSEAEAGQQLAAAPDQDAGPPPLPIGPAIELPGARQIVGRGFDLSLQASRQLRAASLYVGALLVAFAGPLVVLSLAVVGTAPDGLDQILDRLADPGAVAPRSSAPTGIPGDWLTSAWLLTLVGLIGVAGVTLVAVEGQVVGVAILAGRRVGRPLGLREAIIRSRQTFWRVIWATSLVAIPLQAFRSMVVGGLDSAGAPAEASVLVGTILVTTVGALFGYVMTGIVIGDVGPAEAIRRSVRLARARWRIALVIAFFPAIFSSIQLLGLAVGGDLVVRFGEAVGLGFGTDALRSIATLLVILAAIAAAGSLIFTVSALFAAPQVVAFLGLTQFQGGLDQARSGPRVPGPVASPDPTGAPVHDPAAGFRWVTRPMAAAIATSILLATVGLGVLADRL